MARPIFNNSIASGQESWDTDTNDNFTILKSGPFPLYIQDAGKDETDIATDFPVAENDDTFAIVRHTTKGNILYYCDGSTWTQLLDDQMPVQAASTATILADLVTDFNALLTKLKNAGRMAT